LFTLSGVWVFAICALTGLLVYVSTELRGRDFLRPIRARAQ
jgi:hypothetical protein